MTRFQDLLAASPNSSPSREQDRASRELPAVVRASRLHWWEPSAPPAGGTAVLLVVAPWSHYDLAMLDVLDESVPGPDRPGEAPPVFVANLERYRSVEE